MVITCCICSKKQSGLIENFPLYQGSEGLRICDTCHKHLQAIEQGRGKGDADPSIAYFNVFLAQGLSFEVADRIQTVIKDYAARADDYIGIKKTDSVSPYASATPYRNVSGSWTGFAKIIIVIFLIVCFIMGIVLGSNIGDFYYEAFTGGVIGAVIGLLIGSITAAISMVVIEISENIQQMLINSNKLLDVMEKNQRN